MHKSKITNTSYKKYIFKMINRNIACINLKLLILFILIMNYDFDI